MRVVSLVPSATEMLAAIGGEELLVGRSHDSNWPPEIADVPVVSSTSIDTAAAPDDIDQSVTQTMDTTGTLHVLNDTLLAELRPDIVLTQDTCAVCAVDSDQVRSVLPHATVITSSPNSLEEMFDDMVRIGEACGLPDAARREVARLRDRWWSARDQVNPYLDGPPVAVIEWSEPIYLAGHWTPTLIHEAGGQCVLSTTGQPSCVATWQDLVDAQPEFLVVAPCGVPLDACGPHLDTLTQSSWWPELPAVRHGHVAVHDGTRSWSRPGPGLVTAFEWLVAWLNDRPEAMPRDFPVRCLPVDPASSA